MLELRGVCYRYGKKLPMVLDGVDFAFERGRIYSVTGESGAGKSTLISLIAGLDAPTGGEITFDGINIKKIRPSVYRSQKIGLVFQGNNLILRQTARENVETALYLGGAKYPERIRRAAELLEAVNLTPDKHRRTILELSGGEQQRVAVARAIANAPEVIIADEPTGNLDEGNAEQVMALLSGEAYKNGRCVYW